MRRVIASARLVLKNLSAELRRLNNAGLDPDRLAANTRRERIRAVKDALTLRHRSPSRCC
jgi:hypothetical protein